MTTYTEAMEFYEKQRARELRRFLAVPVTPTGFDSPHDFCGRGPLIQIADFTERDVFAGAQETQRPSSVQRTA
jgi:hypothetical protein